MKNFKHIHSNEDFKIATALLGETERLSLGIKEVLERMIWVLYKAKDEVNVNNARYMLFSNVNFCCTTYLFHLNKLLFQNSFFMKN